VPPVPRIGTAGWSIPRAVAERFVGEGTHLQRYARVLPCCEINSSFYRPHAAATYARWAASTPDEFRFAVKVPRAITHEGRLRRAREPLARFLEETDGLGRKRGPLLVQLPPSHAFDLRVVRGFFTLARALYGGPLACEPRHASWFSPRATRTLVEFDVARVAADPACVPEAARPGGSPALWYVRLHGSPRMYWSPYDASALDALLTDLRRAPAQTDVWCLFDNTASGAALENALDLQARQRAGVRSSA
jgi:uncharacterized protein YecE (DUF72 family)